MRYAGRPGVVPSSQAPLRLHLASGSTIRNAKRKLCRFRRSWWSANRAARLLPTEASSRRHQLAAALLQELLDLVAPLFRERIAEHEQD